MESDDLQLTSAPQVLPSPTGQQTAKRAVEILLASGQGFAQPTAKQREALLIAFVQEGFVIYGKAFHIVKVAGEVDLTSVEDIRRRLDSITLYEVKSTGKAAVDSDFRRYFFSLSTAELLVAQNLGSRYRFESYCRSGWRRRRRRLVCRSFRGA